MIDILHIVAVIMGVGALFFLRYVILLLMIPYQLNTARRLADSDNDRAQKILEGILRISRHHAAASWLMASIYQKRQHHVLALMYLNDIITCQNFTMDVTEIKVRQCIARIYHVQGESRKAFQQYTILLKKNLFSLAGIKEAIRQCLDHFFYSEALDLLKTAMADYPDDGELLFLFASVDFHNKDYSLAREKLNMALQKGYDRHDLHLLMGKLFFTFTQYEQALEHLRKLPDRYIQAEDLEGMISKCLYELHDYQELIYVLENYIPRVRERKHFAADMMFMLCRAYEESGNMEKARSICEAIRAKMPLHPEIKKKLAFYQAFLEKQAIQNYMSLSKGAFMDRAEKLLEELGYSVRDTLEKEKNLLEYLCTSRNDAVLFNLVYVVFTRQTIPVSEEFLHKKLLWRASLKAKKLMMIAPFFEEDAMIYAQRNAVIVHTLDIFEESRIQL